MNIFQYNPIGPKEDEYKPYQKINSIRKMIDEIDIEAVEAYSFTFAKMLTWIKLAMEVRKEDVIKRILNNRRLKSEREAAIQQEEERQKERQTFFEEEKAKWDEEMEKRREAEEERKAREKEAREEEDEEDGEYSMYIDSDEDNKSEKDKGEGEEEDQAKDKKEGEGAGEGEDDEEEKFDEAEVYERFDEEKPPIEIPPEVIDDIDNDIDITEEDLSPQEDQD